MSARERGKGIKRAVKNNRERKRGIGEDKERYREMEEGEAIIERI